MIESRRAIRGMLTVGAGQLLNVGIGLIMAMWVPRVFGSTDYGHWIYFRSLIVFWVGFGLLGAGDVISRFYIGYRAEGRPRDAARVFNSVLMLRCLLVCPLAVIGATLLLTSSNAFAYTEGGIYLGASIVFQSIGITFNLLLYGDRRLGRHAGINALQAAVVPAAVLMAYYAGDLHNVPLACMLGDLSWMIAAFVAARPWRFWSLGWLSRTEIGPVLMIGGVAAFFSLVMNVYMNLTPYLMDLRGYDIRAIGIIGFALRIALMASLGLMSVGSGLYPSLSSVAASDSIGRAIVWQNICTRYGMVLFIPVLGVFLFIGPWLVPKVLGENFTGTSGVMALVLFSVMPMWVVGQFLRLSLLVKRTQVYGRAGLALLAGFLVPLLVMEADTTGMRVAWAMVIGSVCCQGVAMYGMRDYGLHGFNLRGILFCLALLLVPIAARAGLEGVFVSISVVILWIGLFIGVAWWSRAFQLCELGAMWRAVQRRSLSSGHHP